MSYGKINNFDYKISNQSTQPTSDLGEIRESHQKIQKYADFYICAHLATTSKRSRRQLVAHYTSSISIT